jgi:hypothetical protein
MMKNNRWLMLLTLLLLLGFTVWGLGAHTEQKRIQWEYTAIVPTEKGLDQMNKLGAEGWELVAVQGSETAAALGRPALIFYFKRPKQ